MPSQCVDVEGHQRQAEPKGGAQQGSSLGLEGEAVCGRHHPSGPQRFIECLLVARFQGEMCDPSSLWRGQPALP